MRNKFGVSIAVIAMLMFSCLAFAAAEKVAKPGQEQGGELAACSKGRVQSDHASLWAEIGSTHGQVESAAGRENSRSITTAGTIS